MIRLWAKREAQIQEVWRLGWDIWGFTRIAGKALPEIAALELRCWTAVKCRTGSRKAVKDQSDNRRVRYM